MIVSDDLLPETDRKYLLACSNTRKRHFLTVARGRKGRLEKQMLAQRHEALSIAEEVILATGANTVNRQGSNYSEK